MYIFSKGFLRITLLVIVANIFFDDAASGQHSPRKWSLQAIAGIQQANADWSIAGNLAGENPNILSELVWKNLKGVVAGLDLSYQIYSHLNIKFSGQYQSIASGTVSDTDYAEDNRNRPFYQDQFNAEKGYLFNMAIQATYRLVSVGKVTLSPLVGINSYNNKFYLIGVETNAYEKDLNSTYQNQYKGVDLGLEAELKLRYLDLRLQVLYGRYGYSARANWNLIPVFEKPVSFTHQANAGKLAAKLQGSIPLNHTLAIDLAYRIKKFNAFKGTDKAYLINQIPEDTQFNGSQLTTNSLSAGITLRF